MRLWGKGRVSETKEGMRCSSLNAISSLGVHSAQQKKSGRPYGKAPALEYAGAEGNEIRHPNAGSTVSQHDRSSTTSYSQLCLRGND